MAARVRSPSPPTPRFRTSAASAPFAPASRSPAWTRRGWSASTRRTRPNPATPRSRGGPAVRGSCPHRTRRAGEGALARAVGRGRYHRPRLVPVTASPCGSATGPCPATEASTSRPLSRHRVADEEYEPPRSATPGLSSVRPAEESRRDLPRPPSRRQSARRGNSRSEHFSLLKGRPMARETEPAPCTIATSPTTTAVGATDAPGSTRGTAPLRSTNTPSPSFPQTR